MACVSMATDSASSTFASYDAENNKLPFKQTLLPFM